jgi:hypothetical protein
MTFEAQIEITERKTVRYEVPVTSMSEMVNLAVMAAREANPQAARITVLEVNPQAEAAEVAA